MNKTILKLVFLATTTVHAAPPKKDIYNEMYNAMQEEAKRATERAELFKALMEENEKYEIDLARSKEQNERNIQEITFLNVEVNRVNAALELTEKRLNDAQITCAKTEKELGETKMELNSTLNDLSNIKNELMNARKLQQDQQKEIEHNNKKINAMSEERKMLEKKLQDQEGFFKNTLNNFAAALGLPNTRSAPEAKAIQQAIYHLKASEKNLSEINKQMKETIKTQRNTIQILEEKNKILEQKQKEQTDLINEKENAIQALNTQCTKLENDLRDVSKKAATAEEKNMALGKELNTSLKRVDTLEKSLNDEQHASQQFKQNARDALENLSKKHAETLTEALQKSEKAAKDAFFDLFNEEKKSGSSSDGSPKTVKKSGIFSLLNLGMLGFW